MTDKTNSKLIKISDEHFVVVDDSEIKAYRTYNETECHVLHIPSKSILACNGFGEMNGSKTIIFAEPLYGREVLFKECKKITHSTEPLETGVSIDFETIRCFNQIKPIYLLDIEESIHGYNLDKMAVKVFGPFGLGLERATIWKAGFKACRELYKDKLFTIDDMDQAYICGLNDAGQPGMRKMREDYIKSIQPKTEWDVEFDEQGRMLIKC